MIKLSGKITRLREKEKYEYINLELNKWKIDYIYNFIDDKLLVLKFNYNNTEIIMTICRIKCDKGIKELIKVRKSVF